MIFSFPDWINATMISGGYGNLIETFEKKIGAPTKFILTKWPQNVHRT